MRYIVTIVFLSCLYIVQAQKVWEIPVENTKPLSPYKFTTETQAKGKEVYTKNCLSCHGNPTKADFAKLTPVPGDVSTSKFKQDTDGELYYKITTGKGLMPSFKATLTPEQVWNLISYIRTFHSGYAQKIAEKIATEGATVDNIKLLIQYLQSSNKVEVKALSKDPSNKALQGIEVKLFAERYFGDLLLDEPKITDNLGIAQFLLPKDLPGDSTGNVTVIAQVMPEGALNPISEEKKIAFGKKSNNPPLTEGRHLWSKLVQIPIWLILTYLVVVLTVFGFIGIVMLKLKKIFEIGKKEIENEK